MRGHPVERIPDFLRGHWQVRREIIPLRNAPSGAFEGEAQFVARGTAHDVSPAQLVYVERGDVRIGDHHGRASRELRYEQAAGPVRVLFADGRFFHDLDLREGVWYADHPCGSDLYRGRFRVLGPDVWEQLWTVTGPSADYQIRTRLTRRGGYASGPFEATS